MNLTFIEEPELEFGTHRHIDIRFGIMNYGTKDFDSPVAPKKIELGLIGNGESLEGVQSWFEKCRNAIPGKSRRDDPSSPSKQPNLFPRFPGFGPDTAFRSCLTVTDSLCRSISNAEIAHIRQLPNRNDRISRAVDLFIDEVGFLSQETNARVIVCALPNELLQSMGQEELDDDIEEDEDLATELKLDFHDLLKARAMQQYRKPIQLIRPPTWGGKEHRQTRLSRKREVQDEATRAWNIHTALYYKAGGVPWRLPRESTDLTVCYVGVSFYKSIDGRALLTSIAQVFNERGEGVVVRGGTAAVSKEDLQPHLPEAHAYELLKSALERYRSVHMTLPARVVIHKSSRFNSDEKAGFEAALQDHRVATSDFLWITSSHTKLYRAGKYPPLRGTLLTLDEHEMVLYTRGSVDFFETYPGMYIPVPLRIYTDKNEQTQRFLAREILALSKMNWNKTQFDGAEPVTLEASRKCSNVLRYCSEGRQIEPRYSFYM
jgi:hypothetical protein